MRMVEGLVPTPVLTSWDQRVRLAVPRDQPAVRCFADARFTPDEAGAFEGTQHLMAGGGVPLHVGFGLGSVGECLCRRDPSNCRRKCRHVILERYRLVIAFSFVGLRPQPRVPSPLDRASSSMANKLGKAFPIHWPADLGGPRPLLRRSNSPYAFGMEIKENWAVFRPARKSSSWPRTQTNSAGKQREELR